MPSFLPPVVMELRAEGTQAIAEMAKVGESARAMADKAVLASQREVAAAKESAAQAKAAAEEKTALARKAAAEQEQASIAQINKALAEGSVTAQEAAAEQQAAAEKAAAAVSAAEAKEAEAARATAKAQAEAAAAVQASSEAEVRAYAAQGAASDAVVAKHKANAKALVDASNVVTGVALAAAGIIGVAALDEAAKFQKSTELLVTAGGESQGELANVRSGIMQIAEGTGTATDQLAEGMYVMEKAGYRGADGLHVLQAAAEGAKAENVDLATMTQAVTDVMLDYGKKASDAVSVTNGLVAASGLAKTTMQDFASSMAAIVPTASVAGLSFAQVGGALATMTQHGESAQQSSQNLANLLTQLERPSNIASKAMQQMGIDVTDLSKNIGDENGGRGLLGSLQMIDQHIKDNMGKDGTVVMDTMQKSATATQALHKMLAQMPPELAKLSNGFLDGSVTGKEYVKGYKDMNASAFALGSQFATLAKSTLGVNDLLKSGNSSIMTYVGAWNRAAGGITGARTALMLLMNNANEFQNNIEAITKAEEQNGQHIATWAETQKTFSVQLDMTKQAAANLGIEIGTRLFPVAQQLMGGVTDLIHGFEQGNPVLHGAADAIALLAAATVTAKVSKWAISTSKELISLGTTVKDMAARFHIGFATVGTDAELGATRMERFGGAVSKALPTLGKMGIAAVAAGAAIKGLAMAQEAWGTNGMAPSVEQTTNALIQLGGSTDSLFQKWDSGPMKSAPSDVHNLDQAVGYLNDKWAQAGDGITQFGNVFTSIIGVHMTDGMEQVNSRLGTMGESLSNMVTNGALDTAARGFDQIAESFTKQGMTAQQALDKMPAYRDALLAQAHAANVSLSDQELLEFAMGKVPEKMAAATKSTGDYVDAAGKIQPITPELQKSLEAAGVSADGLVTDLDKVRQGMEADGLATVNARDAQSRMNQSMDDAKKAMDDFVNSGHKVGEGLNAQATDFDLTTDAGRQLNDKYEAVMKSGESYANSIKGTGVDAEKQVQQALTDTYTHLVDAGHQMGITGGKADDLARQVMGIPPGVDIHTWMDDYAKKKAEETDQAVRNIPDVKTVVVDVQVNNQGALDPGQYADAQRQAQSSGKSAAFATGGLVGGYPAGGLLTGPGTGTSDSMIARVSNGEYVVRAAAVQRVGVGFLDQLNSGNLHPAPGSPQMSHVGGAGGGNVTVYATTNASPHQIASEVGWALRNQN